MFALRNTSQFLQLAVFIYLIFFNQGSIVERLKLESARLRQQLRESQERALRDKEQLARHLETIQQDMMEREAAFQEIQRERLMIEDTFNTQVNMIRPDTLSSSI